MRHDVLTSSGTTAARLVAAARVVARRSGRRGPGTARLGSGPVGDVLTGEGVLVHLGAHVAGIDDEDAQVAEFDGEHPAGVVERGLRRAVDAPALVGLDRGIGGDRSRWWRRRAR